MVFSLFNYCYFSSTSTRVSLLPLQSWGRKKNYYAGTPSLVIAAYVPQLTAPSLGVPADCMAWGLRLQDEHPAHRLPRTLRTDVPLTACLPVGGRVCVVCAGGNRHLLCIRAASGLAAPPAAGRGGHHGGDAVRLRAEGAVGARRVRPWPLGQPLCPGCWRFGCMYVKGLSASFQATRVWSFGGSNPLPGLTLHRLITVCTATARQVRV